MNAARRQLETMQVHLAETRTAMRAARSDEEPTLCPSPKPSKNLRERELFRTGLELQKPFGSSGECHVE